jgi:hypothetical protein
VDQQFESDVMHDLMADAPTMSADDTFQQDLFDDGFEAEGFTDDAMMDGMDQYDEAAEDYGDEAYFDEEGFDDGFAQDFAEDYGDEFIDDFAEDEMDVMDAMEEAVADALDADDTDAFLRRLISGVGRVAGSVRRGAGVARRVAGGVQRVAGQAQRIAGRAQRIAGQVGRVAQGVQGLAGAVEGGRRPGRRRGATGGAAGGLGNILQQLLPMLQQHVAQSSNEMDVFEDLADWFEQEQIDEALPIVAGVAARAALRPVVRQVGAAAGRAVTRQVVRATTQAAQNLTRRQGARAVRALRPIAASVGRVAVRRGMRPRSLPNAIRQTSARVAAQPALTRQITQTAGTGAGVTPRTRLQIRGSGAIPRRMVLNGPVEIIIRR